MASIFRTRKRLPLVLAGAVAACVGLGGVAGADPFGWWAAQPHGFATLNDVAVAGRDGVARGNVLADDFGATAVVRNGPLDNPAAGSLVVQPDGTFSFTPATKGSHGTVHFTYSATDAVRLFQTNLPALDTFGSVTISGGSFGSSFAPAPGRPGYFYGITDRGPNADSGDGNKVEPDSGVDPAHPAFHPMIGLFQLTGSTAKLVGQPIVLKRTRRATPTTKSQRRTRRDARRRALRPASETIEEHERRRPRNRPPMAWRDPARA